MMPLFEEAPLEEEAPAPTWPPDGRTGEWWMIWAEDRSNTPMEQLLGEAVAYFTRKYGLVPNRALVPFGWDFLLTDEKGHPRQSIPQFPGLTTIRMIRTVMKGHVWLNHLPDENKA